ncbi:MAG TPA: glutamyl-tRNA reductase [Phycisphaerae bacterium]|nr:glutamyl-tRNA reductase [Phycisphaerae bacterium]
MKSMIPDSVQLLAVGLNHRTAPLDLRETLAFTPEQLAAALNSLTHSFPNSEAVILSTCNRVELYVATQPTENTTLPTHDNLAHFLADFHQLQTPDLRPHLYHHENRDAVSHLFAVTSSLDSMVVGETQILSQVKQAYQFARDHNAVGGGGKIFHALFQRALAAAKEIHEETNLSAGRLSIASVAVDLVRSVFDRFDDKTILCIGAGKMATLMLRHLADLRPRRLLITNRSPERAQTLAAEFRGDARPFDQLDGLMTEADILLTSTNATEPIITEARFKTLLKPRRYRPAVIVDIAVPRDVESSVGKLSSVYLYNVDDLQEVAAGNREKREQEIAASRMLLNQHIDDFWKWFATRDVGPLVKSLYDRSHAVARAELNAHFARNPHLSEEDRAELERLIHRLIGKLLHPPVSQLTSNPDPSLLVALQKLLDK